MGRGVIILTVCAVFLVGKKEGPLSPSPHDSNIIDLLVGVSFPSSLSLVSKPVPKPHFPPSSPLVCLPLFGFGCVIFNAFSGVLEISGWCAIIRGWVEISLAHPEAARPPLQEQGQAAT